MSFRSEVRSFLVKYERDMVEIKGMISKLMALRAGENAISTQFRSMIVELRKQNAELLDRLAARTYPELKTYHLPGGGSVEYETPKAEELEELAGMAVRIDEDKKHFEV